MDVDLTETIAPNSDQLNADDLLGGPQTFTIADVTQYLESGEKRANIHLAEIPGRPYRPSKTMRRALVIAWGGKGSIYVGRRITLYRDPEVKYGGAKVGGIKISHLSNIDQPLALSLTSTRGKKEPHTVDPLPPAAPEPTVEQVAECADEAQLTAMWRRSGPERQVQIQERVAELRAAPEGTP